MVLTKGIDCGIIKESKKSKQQKNKNDFFAIANQRFLHKAQDQNDNLIFIIYYERK